MNHLKIQKMEKKTTSLKTRLPGIVFLLAVFTLIVTFGLPSCNNAKTEDPKEVANESNDAKFDNKKENDAEFLVAAAEINLEEIQLGQLAQKTSTMTEVKELGKMMEDGHTQAMSDLQALSAKKQITIPSTLTEAGQEANKKLMDKTGKDFDKAYCDMMVNGHKDAIDKFQKASTDATDPDIRKWATSMLPALQTHLDQSITCQKKFEKM